MNDIKGIDLKMKKGFTKKEIIISCICLLEFCIIISGVLISKQNIKLYGDIFTIVTAVVCSILATALTPRIIQNDDSGIGDEINRKMEDFFFKQQCVLPNATYVGTNDPNMEFNEKLNESISKAHQYIYCSDRALYLSKRLGKEIHKVDSRLTITLLGGTEKSEKNLKKVPVIIKNIGNGFANILVIHTRENFGGLGFRRVVVVNESEPFYFMVDTEKLDNGLCFALQFVDSMRNEYIQGYEMKKEGSHVMIECEYPSFIEKRK